MRIVKAPPKARRLIESLRDLGYECATAIADIVDNSIVADATKVQVDIQMMRGPKAPAYIAISDNGRGMDREHLEEAMHFGSDEEYNPEDLGKYGLGLKTASLSQCRKLTVFSKARSKKGTRPRKCIARWDLDHVYKVRDWDLMSLDLEELESWEQEALDLPLLEDGGTTILWSDLEGLEQLSTPDIRRRERELGDLIKTVSEHLSMVFHRYMQGLVNHKRRVTIFVAGVELNPWDPFCLDEDTMELEPFKPTIHVKLEGQDKSSTQKITIKPYVLPRENEFSSKAKHEAASGPLKWNQQQGLYFYRNDRLMQAGGWSNIRAVDEHQKLLRIAVFFNGHCDDAFAINISKMRARIPVEIREEFRNYNSKWGKTADDRYRNKINGKKWKGSKKDPAPSPSKQSNTGKGNGAPSMVHIGAVSMQPSSTGSASIVVAQGPRPGTIKMVVPMNHEVSNVFNANGKDRQTKSICFMLFGLVESMVEGRIDPKKVPLTSIRRSMRKIL